MQKLHDKDALPGLQKKENSAYSILYQFYFPSIKKFVLKNSGTEADAEDVFQETILVLLQKLPNESFELTSSLKTYIFSISSNIWLKRLRETKKRASLEIENLQTSYHLTNDLRTEEIKPSAGEKLRSIFSKITLHCVRLLRAIFFFKKDARTIMQENGYTSVHNVQNQKYKCIQQARRNIGK